MNTTRWLVLLTSFLFLSGCSLWGGSNRGNDSPNIETALNDDNDGDGVSDSLDDCPESAPRVLVDTGGCELVMGVIEGLTFAPNQSELSDDSAAVLNVYIDVLKRYPGVVVSVEAHTDNRGRAVDNLELSKQRVLSVARHMVTNGIASARIKPYGRGESRPRAANATAEGREQNRRIEIKVVEGLL